MEQTAAPMSNAKQLASDFRLRGGTGPMLSQFSHKLDQLSQAGLKMNLEVLLAARSFFPGAGTERS